MDLEKALQRLGDDKQLLSDLIGFYLEDYTDLLDEIDRALSANDAAALEKSSHSLKGLIANFHDDESRDLARTIELAAKENELDRARRLAPQLRAQADALALRLANHRLPPAE
jgi:HPt (histidine-containing phosphotransfer) domain-containing protein